MSTGKAPPSSGSVGSGFLPLLGGALPHFSSYLDDGELSMGADSGPVDVRRKGEKQ